MTRYEFRELVFARDGDRCVVCGAPAQDAHHILERRLFPDGGYHPDNGVSLCGACHLKAEQTLISVEELRERVRIKRAYLPSHLYSDEIYDKWGNQILSNGVRLCGELFFDESVQKVLGEGGVLGRFSALVKYPRTHHLPWSPGVHDDDRVIESLEMLENAQEVVATIKMDGENTTLCQERVHARSVTSADHVSRHWVKNLWSRVAHDIPEGWRVCGENLWAVHSIRYDNLESYFLGFSVWNEHNVCLAWGETLEWLELLGLNVVPVFYRGVFRRAAIQEAFDSGPGADLDRCEGYVVRDAGSFAYRDFKMRVAKWVRFGHVQTSKHWFLGQRIEQNNLLLSEKSEA